MHAVRSTLAVYILVPRGGHHVVELYIWCQTVSWKASLGDKTRARVPELIEVHT